MQSSLAALRLIGWQRVRAIYAAVRHSTERAVRYETDPDLVELVAEPYESLEDTRGRLERLKQRLCRRDDRRAVFLAIYTAMTRAVENSVERGQFSNSAWMRSYTVTFADYYRQAFLDYEKRRLGRVPDPWRIAFDTAVAGDALVTQDAFLGINAHINYDLALAVREVGVATDRATKYDDHRLINQVLARLVDTQQETLSEQYAPGIDDVDAALGRLDESVALFTMTEGREQAWRVAVVLTDTDSGVVARFARWLLRTTATGGAVLVLSPALDAGTMRALQRVERDQFDVGDTVELLDSRFGAIE